MQFTVALPGGQPETYSVVDRPTFAEARKIQELTGMTYDEATKATPKGDSVALQAMVYIAMKRQRPTLKPADLDDVVIDDIAYDRSEDQDQAGEPDVDGPGNSSSAGGSATPAPI